MDFFLFLWVIFALLDTDPDLQFNCGSGSSNSNECGVMRIWIRIRNPGCNVLYLVFVFLSFLFLPLSIYFSKKYTMFITENIY
jgi:hypothetical protein